MTVSVSYCVRCGAALASDHQFCPRCGAAAHSPLRALSSTDAHPSPGAASPSDHPVVAFLAEKDARGRQAADKVKRQKALTGVIVLAIMIAASVWLGSTLFSSGSAPASPSYTAVNAHPDHYLGTGITWTCTVTHTVPALAAVACRVAPFTDWLQTGEIVVAIDPANTPQTFNPGERLQVSGTVGLPLSATDQGAAGVVNDLWIEGATATRR